MKEGGASWQEIAAELRPCFVEHGLVPTSGKHPCRLAAGRAADHKHPLRMGRRGERADAFACRFRIHGAVDRRIGLDAAHAAFLAAEAGADLLGPAAADLLHDIRVCQKRTAERDDVAGAILEFLAGKRSLAPVPDHALEAEAERDREVPAAGLGNLLADLLREAQAVLERSAMLVVAAGEERDRELVDQAALVHGMDFDAIEACALGIEGAFAEGGDNAMDLVCRERSAGLVEPAVGNGGGCHRREPAEVLGDGDTAKSAAHHQEDL